MFERRLGWLSGFLGLLVVVIVVRLVDIQVVRAADYEALADRLLTRPVRYLNAPRGSILDRNGRVLVEDRPTHDVCIRYEVLAETVAGRPLPQTTRYLRAVVRELKRHARLAPEEPIEAAVADLRDQIASMWDALASLTNTPRSELMERAAAVVERVRRVRQAVAQARGRDEPIREESWFHAVAGGLPADAALRARMALDGLPWVDVAPGSQRVAVDDGALLHVLGRLGPASLRSIQDDPQSGDALRRLQSGDFCGISGVERVAEPALRGTRGRLHEDWDHVELSREDPIRGQDVTLALDADLQAAVLDILRQAVESSPHPAGGSAVVLDVATREALALANFPTYSAAEFEAQYDRLRRDWRWEPLRFRAVANQYPPGSTCKAITLYGALADRKTNPDERIRCTGMFLPDHPNQFRCWIYNQYPGVTHDMTNPGGEDADDAIRNSCNIYFYTVGDRLGPERLCHWFSQFGLGRSAGTGLIEESLGVVPTSAWLARNRPSDPAARAADAWNWSIGQGEVTASPLQAANVAATIAAGEWAPVRLARDAAGHWLGDEPGARVPLDDACLRPLRAGMYRVVNERGGTAHDARLPQPGYVLCGKTGSAQTSPRVLDYRYTLEWPDGRREERVGQFEEDVIDASVPQADRPRIVGRHAHRRFPELERLPAHAWFIGFTQRDDTPRGDRPRGKAYAICVLIEFGGSGGQVAAPAARRIAEYLLRNDQEWG